MMFSDSLKKLCTAGVVAAIGLAASVANATPVTFNLSGSVTSIAGDPEGMSVGDSLSGSITFDKSGATVDEY